MSSYINSKVGIGQLLAMLSLVIAPSAVQAASGSGVIEEVVVTAQKRAQSVNDVPVSISALDENTLSDANLNDVTNTIPYVPGLNGQASGMATNSWNIRGIGTNDWSSGSEPAVGVYIDDAYVGRNVMATTAFFDVERIEVLKGPQGTLFGRNASAGAINVITRKPEDTNSLYLAYGGGNEDARRIEMVVNVALGEGFALRLAALDKELSGISTNRNNGRDLYQDERMLRLTARWDATDSLTALLSAHYNEAQGNRVRPHNAGFASLFGLPGAADPFASDVTSDSPNEEDVETQGWDLRLEWQLNDTLAFTSITDVRRSDYGFAQDVDGIGTPLNVDLGDLFIGVPNVLVADGPTRFFQPDIESDTFSQEFRLSGSQQNFDWFIGTSYFSEDLSENANFSWPLTVDLDALLGAGGQVLVQTDADPARYALDADVTSLGVYGDVAWHVTEEWTLTLGLRWSKDEKDYCIANTDPTFGLVAILGPDTAGQAVCDEESWSEVTPRTVVSFQPNDNLLWYASYAKGYKGGGYNTKVAGLGPLGGAPFALVGFDPETSDAFEIGMKATLLEGAMQLNVSGYHTNYEDLQLLDTDLSLTISNIGDVESRGIEAELNWLPPVDGLSFAANLSVNDSEIDAPGRSIDGSDLNQSPNTTYGLNMTYLHALSDLGTLQWFVGYNWQDDQLFDVNGARVEQSSYGLLDAALTYQSADERWRVTLSGQNLGDKEYLTSAADPLGLGAPVTVRNLPRLVMLKIALQLGGQ